MEQQKGKKLILPPVVVDTLNGRHMRTPEVVMDNFNTLLSLRPPHLLSPEHLMKLKDLPY